MDGFEHVLPVEVGVTSLSLYPGSTRRANRSNETAILSDISLRIPGSSLTAIMGGSGSGKTSLLNALAGRSNGFLSGTVTMNGRPASDYSGKIAYVQQNDQLLPFLTVRDTLRYAARLRLPNDMPIQKKYELVESVLLELNLKECADTIIGDDRRKGCSGGEKRRVSIGVQLLVNPSVIYMDEPTTGLDSTTSLSLIETLVSLCRKGRTVCISIHQPRTAIFSKFENVILLTGGNLIYSGPCADVLDHFAKNAHPIPDKINPADFLIDVTSIDNRDAVAEEASKTRINLLVDAWASEKKQGSASPVWGQEAGDMELISQASTKDGTAFDVPEGQVLGKRRMGASPLNQTIILAQRTFHNLLQDRLTLWGSVLEVMILAAAVGAIFYKLDETQQGILGRKASLYIVASVQNYLGLMFAVFKLSLEMKVFDRERLDRMYGVVPYLLGWLIANFALYTALACLFSVIIYYMIGLRTDSLAHLGVFMLGNVLMQFVTISWAYFCIAWARDFATASLIANSFFTFLSTSSGFFIQLDQIPVYLRWFEHISYVTYGYRLLATNEFSGVTFACPDMLPGEKSCQGEVILKSLAFGVDDYVYPAVALLLNYVGLMVLAALVLQFKPQGGPTHAASVKKDKTKTEIRDEEAQSVENESSVPRVDIKLENVTLMLTKTSPTKSDSAKTATILDNISAEFKPGELSIILGASGAGKTSLMNVLMGRGLQAGPFTKTHQSGRILYRGIEMDDRAQIATMVSLCVQDDHHLLPGLSARETLRYSAILRLPAEIPEDEKIRRADKVLLELGLKSCADRLVGGEGVKVWNVIMLVLVGMKRLLITSPQGLSGGEKRRLSIGIQILTNPAVLIIDEPTSGLDAYTSHNLIVKLKSIASSGRTVICSIHQPRSDIVNLFDFSLLLARGGRTVFSGESSKMLPYFAQLDHPIPPFTNPADFALDLSSIDLRNAEAEASSRARVNELIRVWRTDAERDRALGLLAEEASDASSKRLAGSASDLDLSALGYRSPARFGVALSVLVKRSMRNMLRQPKLASARIMQVVALAVIFALYFSRLHLTQPSVQSRFGLLQQQGSLIFVGMLNCIAVFPQELSLMRFEYRDNVYSVGSFFLSYCINEFPFEVASALLYAVVTMFAIGLQASVTNFFVLAYLAFCLLNTGESLGIAFCAMVDSVGFSVQIMSTVMSLQVMMAGFLSVTMPGFLQGLNYVFITRYVARLLAVQEFDGLHFFCQPSEVAAGTCMYQTGSDALALLKFDDSHSVWVFNLIMVAALTLGVRAIAYAVLWSRTKV
ncbi:hypothetical protein HDU88_003669 [Geranomyces variabilis]|nr:hypothetical protein HDU88_003669 [Geranomyces variabilis]